MLQSQPRQQVLQQNQTEQMQVLQRQANHAQAALQAKQTHNDCFHSKQRNPALFFYIFIKSYQTSKFVLLYTL